MRSAWPPTVIVPSLLGGWVEVVPYRREPATITHLFKQDVVEVFGRKPAHGDFVGFVGLKLPGDALGTIELWDRDAQLALLYFFDSPHRITGGFPHRRSFLSPSGRVAIDSVTRRTAGSGSNLAELTVSITSLRGAALNGRIELPTATCVDVRDALIRLLPAVSDDDLDT
jgi:hypothetical protein